MESFLLLMNSVIDSWMSPSFMDIAMDMSITIMCGVGLFFLLIPFLRECPLSPPPGNKTDTPKDVKRGQSNARKKTAAGKGHRDGGKNVEETKIPSQSMEIFVPQPLWNPNQKLNHLLLTQMLSYLKVLEGLILKNFYGLFWGASSIFSESVSTSAHVFRSPSLAECKCMRFVDACGPAQALSQAQGPSQHRPLPHQIVTPNVVDVKQLQQKKILQSSTPKQTPRFNRRAYEVSCPSTERRMQASPPPESLPWKHALNSKDTKDYDNQKYQKAISKHTGNLPRDTLQTKAWRPASILPEHRRILQHYREPQKKDKATDVGEQQRTPFRFLQSRKLTQHQGEFPAKSNHSKSRSQLSQPTQPSILISKSYKCSKMRGSVPTEVPLKKDTEKCVMCNTINKDLGVGAKNLPCNSSSTPGKGPKPRHPGLRTNKLSYMNPCLLDYKTERKQAQNTPQLPVTHRRASYLQILEARDVAPPGVPESNLPQFVFPTTPICDYKEEYYSKAAMVLENLHHQDPGGTRIESATAHSQERAVSIHSPAEVQETQRAPPPAASHGASRAIPDPLQTQRSVQQPAFYFQAKPKQGRILRGIGKGSQHPNTKPKMGKHAPQKIFQEVDSGHHPWNVTMTGSGETVPLSAAKQSNAHEVKEELLYARKVRLGSREIHNGQDINMSPRDFGVLQANRSPGHLQTPTPQYSQDSSLNAQGYNIIILSPNKNPEAYPVRHYPDGPSRADPAKVSLPSEHSLPSFQTRCQDLKNSWGLCDGFINRHERVDTQKNRAPKNKSEVKTFYLHEERQSTKKSKATSQGERLGRRRPSIPSSTHPKDTVKTWIPEKGEAGSKSSWKNNPRNSLKYGNISTKYIGQRDSLKKNQPTPTAEQEVWTRKRAINSVIDKVQSLMSVLLHILENTEGNPSKEQGCEVESLTFKQSSSSQSSVGLYDTDNDRTASEASPKIWNFPFTYRGIGGKLLSGIKAQGACYQHLNQGKRGMGLDKLPMPRESDLPYRRNGEIQHQQEPGLADQRACDPVFFTVKTGMDHYPPRSTEGNNHFSIHGEIGDKQQPGFAHQAFDSHHSTNRGMGCGCFLTPTENHPVKHRGTDCSWPSVGAQQDSDTQ